MLNQIANFQLYGDTSKIDGKIKKEAVILGNKTIAVLATLDTKGREAQYMHEQIGKLMAERSQIHYNLAKKIKPDVILLAHGAALVNPEDAQYMLNHTDCHGVQLGSSIERMAIEKPLEERSAMFKAIHFPKR